MRAIDREQPPTARGAATRRRIVGAAARLMRRSGVGSTSLDAVLEASEASKSQLYHYFADKDDLVLAVVRRQAESVLATQLEHLDGVDSIDGLRRWRDGIVAFTGQNKCAGGCPLGSLVSELAESPQSREVLREGFARVEAEFVDRLRAIRGDAARPHDAELADLATTLLAALQGGLLLAQTMRSTRPLELALDAAIDRVAARLPSSRRARPGSRRAGSPKQPRRSSPGA